ncbi:MAG: type II secretion system protein [Candidatus Omnitrophica bacterium]|nr:type II secretion system protein [Candidatus Omnitrophota bacterium]
MKKKGFTLVEVMVSLVILALLAAGLFSVFVSARYMVVRSKRRLGAMEVARAEIEKNRQHIRADRWDNASYPLFPADGTWRACASTTYPGYTVDCRVVQGPAVDSYRTVTVRVRWSDPSI